MKEQVKNYMEELVFEKLEQYMSMSGCCTCDGCKQDVAAIVLNNLPPKYVVTEKGALITKAGILKPQFEIDLMAKVVEACKVVSASPRHCSKKI